MPSTLTCEPEPNNPKNGRSVQKIAADPVCMVLCGLAKCLLDHKRKDMHIFNAAAPWPDIANETPNQGKDYISSGGKRKA